MYNYGLTKRFKQMQQYVVYFESANYAGYGEHVLVWANSEEEAMSNDALIEYAEEFYREQDEAQYIEENGEDVDGVQWASIMSAEKLKGSRFEEFVGRNPEQYPEMNLPE